jgi:hypothetical protein
MRYLAQIGDIAGSSKFLCHLGCRPWWKFWA